MNINLKMQDINKKYKEGGNFLCRFNNTQNNYTLEQLAELNEVDPELLLIILLHFENSYEEEKIDTQKFQIIDILRYLKITHNHYKKIRFHQIEREIFNLYKHKKESDYLISPLTKTYCDFKNHFTAHMEEEETELFPLLKKIASKEIDNI